MTANEDKKAKIKKIYDVLIKFSTIKNNVYYPANNKKYFFGIDLLLPDQTIKTMKAINFEQLPQYFSNGTSFIPLTQAELAKLTITIVSNELDEKQQNKRILENYPVAMLIDSIRKGKDFMCDLNNINFAKSYIILKDSNPLVNFGNKTFLLQIFL